MDGRQVKYSLAAVLAMLGVTTVSAAICMEAPVGRQTLNRLVGRPCP